jgi:hypothetical protein
LRQERKLQRWMKELLSRKGLNVDNCRYIRSTSDELVIIHKHSLKPRTIMLRREVEVMNITQFTRITNS